MPMFEELLSKIAKALDAEGIPYMVTGGQAVLLHGEPRLTRDIDITLGAAADRVSDLLKIAHSLDLKPLPQDPESFVLSTLVLPVRDEATGIRVDFIFSMTPYEREAIARARKSLIAGMEVSFASVEDLIILKIFAHRPRDMEDVKNILVKNPGADVALVKKWLRLFDRSSRGEGFLKRKPPPRRKKRR
jgi:predicted nucleotidyltransferase